MRGLILFGAGVLVGWAFLAHRVHHRHIIVLDEEAAARLRA